MAEIIDDTEWRSCSSNKGNSPKWIGIVKLPADVNQMIRSEKVINIRSGLEKKGWNIVTVILLPERICMFSFSSPVILATLKLLRKPSGTGIKTLNHMIRRPSAPMMWSTLPSTLERGKTKD